MKYPIAKIRREGVKALSKYLMYDTKTKEKKIMDRKEIGEDIEQIRGFSNNVNGPFLINYYTNLGYIGEEKPDKDIKYYSLIKQIFFPNNIYYKAIDRTGEQHLIVKEDLIEMIEQGHQIAGAMIVNEILKISSEVEYEYGK